MKNYYSKKLIVKLKKNIKLNLQTTIKNYKLKYDIENNQLLDAETNEPFLIFSFDEAAFQFNNNSVKMWSLNKPTSNKYTSKVAGSYSLTPNGVNDLYFMEN